MAAFLIACHGFIEKPITSEQINSLSMSMG